MQEKITQIFSCISKAECLLSAALFGESAASVECNSSQSRAKKKCYAIRKNGKKFGSYNKMSYLCTLKHLIKYETLYI